MRGLRWPGIGRIVIVIVALAAVVGVLHRTTDLFFNPPTSVSSDASAEGWPMFRRNLAHSASVGSGDATPTGTVKWTFATGGPVRSSPAVVGGVVYFGSRDSWIYAVDAAKGIERWRFKTGTFVDSSPAVVGGSVFIGANDGALYALDTDSGELRWKHQGRLAIASSPAVADGVVYVGTRRRELIALDEQSGRPLWVTEVEDRITSSPAVANGLVYVTTLGRFLYSFHARDGRVRLRFQARGGAASSPAVSEENVYFLTSGARLWAVDGSKRSHELEHRMRRIYRRAQLWGIPFPDLGVQTGQLWTRDLGDGSDSSPMLRAGSLYVGVDDRLVAVDLDSHDVRWQANAAGEVTASPAAAGDAVVVGSRDGRLYAVDAATGEVLWTVATGGPIVSSAAVSGGVVYVGSYDGKLYAID